MGQRYSAALLFSVLGVVLVGQGRTYYVTLAGSDATPCQSATSLSSARATIAKGMDCLRAGDTLYIRGGRYAGRNNQLDSDLASNGVGFASGTASSPITVSAWPGDVVTVAAACGQSSAAFDGGEQYWTVTAGQGRLIFDGSAGLGSEACQNTDGVYTTNVAHLTFSGVEVQNWYGNGWHLAQFSDDVRVIGGSTTDAGHAHFGHGLYISGTNHIVRGHRVTRAASYGIHVYGNELIKDGQGRILHTQPSGVVIEDNIIESAGEVCLVFAWGQADPNIARRNVCLNSPAGVQVYTFLRNAQVYNNTFVNISGVALWFQYYDTGNEVRDNLLMNVGEAVRDYKQPTTPGATVTLGRNWVGDPRFVNAAGGDYRLSAGSPAAGFGAFPQPITEPSPVAPSRVRLMVP